MSGISGHCGYLLNTIEVGADRICKCQIDGVGKICIKATETTNASESRNTDDHCKAFGQLRFRIKLV